MFGNLADIRNELRVRLGLPDRGDSGDTRLNTMINMALRQMWSELPKALLQKDIRFIMQPALTNATAKSGHVPLTQVNEAHFSPDHPRVLHIKNIHVKASASQTSDYEGDTLLATDKTWSGRTVEINVNGEFYYRKIQEIYEDEPATVTVTNASDGVTHSFKKYQQYIVMNDPLPFTSAQLALTYAQGGYPSPYGYRLMCEEYPYPEEVQQVVDVIIDPDSNPHPIVQSTFQSELTSYRSSIGFRSEGRPETYCRGSFFQLESPNYKPNVFLTKRSERNNDCWGFIGSTEQNIAVSGVTRNAGPAGTFQYIVMHVWGRRPVHHQNYKATKAALSTATAFNALQLRPFYQSAPSKDSETITVKWGGPRVEITTPNLDYVYGYGEIPASQSYKHFGYEKFIFRKRIATEDFEPVTGKDPTLGPAADVQQVENDSIYYLLAITPGYQTTFYDDGTHDPVDRLYSLEAFSGHFHVRFDRQPTEATPVLMRTFSRPPLLRYDTDTPRIPPECYDALYALTASYMVGDRDGEPARKNLYFSEYKEHLKRMRKTYNVAGHQVGSFGNGLSNRRHSSGPRRNRSITEKS